MFHSIHFALQSLYKLGLVGYGGGQPVGFVAITAYVLSQPQRSMGSYCCRIYTDNKYGYNKWIINEYKRMIIIISTIN